MDFFAREARNQVAARFARKKSVHRVLRATFATIALRLAIETRSVAKKEKGGAAEPPRLHSFKLPGLVEQRQDHLRRLVGD
jgi:hypothetical protein